MLRPSAGGCHYNESNADSNRKPIFSTAVAFSPLSGCSGYPQMDADGRKNNQTHASIGAGMGDAQVINNPRAFRLDQVSYTELSGGVCLSATGVRSVFPLRHFASVI